MKNSKIELKDGPKYNFIESVVGTVAKKKKWDIDQAQAAIWVSTKARFNATKSLFSEKALKSGVGVRKGGHVVPAKGKNKEFADLRFNTAMNYKIASREGWLSRLLLILGGYISGTSLNGAPLLVAVYMQNINVKRLRNTLFVLGWLLIVEDCAGFFSSACHVFPVGDGGNGARICREPRQGPHAWRVVVQAIVANVVAGPGGTNVRSLPRPRPW